MTTLSTDQRDCGWHGKVSDFLATPETEVLESLRLFVTDASDSQVSAWRDSIRLLKSQLSLACNSDSALEDAGLIMEYELPLEARRIDAVLLDAGTVWVIEFKMRPYARESDIDQVAAYSRDLRCYHAWCHDNAIVPLLVMTSSDEEDDLVGEVRIGGRFSLARQLKETPRNASKPPTTTDQFLSPDSYRPLPSLIEAARELFQHGELRAIRRARAATDPSVDCITQIIRDAARTRTRRLILLTGLPGAGKTLVGLRVVHSRCLDELAVDRGQSHPCSPAVFLSGNGPLVEVLQYELRAAGGDGKAFVRGVKDYVKQYSGPRKGVPPEHVLVFDEAQRAWDAARVADGHKIHISQAKSEPDHFIDFAERIPEWCVVIGLIGGGQEIHVGEEAGVGQWRQAIDSRNTSRDWIVHGPPHIQSSFTPSSTRFAAAKALHLYTELRFHAAAELHEFVKNILEGADPAACKRRADSLHQSGYRLRISRDLEEAKRYLRERYSDDPTARFGLVSSSKDKDLTSFGIPNDFQSTKFVKFGPWYGDDETSSGQHSCRLLQKCVTEFGAQGLELDACLLAWGTDFVRDRGKWSNAKARGYRTVVPLRNPYQLRINSYRVLLTRGRDATVVFLPPVTDLDETYNYLVSCGFQECSSQLQRVAGHRHHFIFKDPERRSDSSL